jgi:hypothetical protein
MLPSIGSPKRSNPLLAYKPYGVLQVVSGSLIGGGSNLYPGIARRGLRLLLLDVLAFCFVHPAQALLNSPPQLLARDRRAVAQGAQLGLGDLRTDAAG